MMRARRGFTLVELLVVLVVVGLLASLVTQGISQGLALFSRISTDQGEIYRELIGRNWLRQTLLSAVPDTGFRGQTDMIELTSLRPLLESEGIASHISWRVDAGGILSYTEGEQSFTVSVGPLMGITYLNDEDRWQDEWPGASRSPLPRRIRLSYVDGDSLNVTPLLQPDTGSTKDAQDSGGE